MVFDGAILMMPCLGNVWEDVQDLWRPEFFVLFVIFLCWGPLIKRRLLKIAMRITGGLLSACFVAVLGGGRLAVQLFGGEISDRIGSGWPASGSTEVRTRIDGARFHGSHN
jgi:hypothetical protein